jgi:arylformamidase
LSEESTGFNVHDITAVIHPDIFCWPGEHHLYKHHYARSIDDGDSINVSRISCSMHLGTHVEAPYHKTDNGAKLDEFPLETFMGSAYVIDLTAVEKCITLNDINNVDLKGSSICLIKTRSSRLLDMPSFDTDFIFMDEKSAMYLTDKNIKAVGIDSLGIDPVDNETPHIHNIFLNANILIYEGLDLRDVKEGRYYFIGLPLRVQNAEASPVRAVLIYNE